MPGRNPVIAQIDVLLMKNRTIDAFIQKVNNCRLPDTIFQSVHSLISDEKQMSLLRV